MRLVASTGWLFLTQLASEATSMGDGTTLLFDLPGFRVLDVEDLGAAGRVALIETTSLTAGCPDCGVVQGGVHERPIVALRDLPIGERPLLVRWQIGRAPCRERV